MAKGGYPLTFSSGTVQNRRIARVITYVDKLTSSGSTSTRITKIDLDSNKNIYYQLPWTAIRVAVTQQPSFEVVALGTDGSLKTGNASGEHDDHVDPTNEGPKRRGPLRDMRLIAGNLYATGMSRQVYSRDRSGWAHQDEGVVLPLGTVKVAGFNAIGGLDENELVAVGYGGEIWMRVKRSWREIDSPTNLILYDLTTAADGRMFTCGQQGLLLLGEGSRWSVIEHGETREDFWDIQYFNGTAYVCSKSSLYRLDGGRLIRVDLGLGKNMSFGHLDANDGTLWSFGAKDIAWTNDGEKWYSATPGAR